MSKISVLKGANLLLVVPKNAMLFQNPLNWSILKEKATEQGKEIQVFTNDERGKKILKKIGIKAYLGQMKPQKSEVKTEFSRLPLEQVKKTESKKITITEISGSIRKKSPESIMSSPQKKIQKKDKRAWATFFLFNTLRKKTVIAFSSLAFLVFLAVLYIAIPSATIFIVPASNILETTVNIILADPEKQQKLFRNVSSHVLPAFMMNLDVPDTLSTKSTGKVFTGSSARCNVKILNQRTSSWTLVSKTRFQEKSGIIFRSQEDIEVPAARFQIVKDEKANVSQEKIPGSIIIDVIADEFDASLNIVGARGNFPAGITFVFPGLSKFNQSLLSGITETPCKGGVTQYYSVITEEDLLAGKKKMEEELKKTAKKMVIDALEAENVKRAKNENHTVTSQLILFDHPEMIRFHIKNITVPNISPGTKGESMTFQGSLTVQAFAFEKNTYSEILEQALLAKVHPDKVLSQIDFDSTTYSIVYTDSDLQNFSKIKVSVTVRGLEEYNFDPRTQKGQDIVNHILKVVPGKSLIEASYFISNLPEIKESHISVWPFWKNILPERKSSITIKVQ